MDWLKKRWDEFQWIFQIVIPTLLQDILEYACIWHLYFPSLLLASLVIVQVLSKVQQWRCRKLSTAGFRPCWSPCFSCDFSPSQVSGAWRGWGWWWGWGGWGYLSMWSLILSPTFLNAECHCGDCLGALVHKKRSCRIVSASSSSSPECLAWGYGLGKGFTTSKAISGYHEKMTFRSTSMWSQVHKNNEIGRLVLSLHINLHQVDEH